MIKEKEPQPGPVKAQPDTKIELHNTDELVSRITSLTKDSCDPEALANARQEESEKDNKKDVEKAPKETQERMYMQGYRDIMDKVVNNEEHARDREERNLSILKAFVKDHVEWCKITGGKGTVLKKPKKERKGRVSFVAGDYGSLKGTIGFPIMSDSTCYIKNMDINERWAGFAMMGWLQRINEANFKRRNDEKPVREIRVYTVELSAINRTSGSKFLGASQKIIKEYQIESYKDFLSLYGNKNKWKEVREKFEAVFTDNTPANDTEIKHRDAVYAITLIMELADITSRTIQHRQDLLIKYYTDFNDPRRKFTP